MKRIPWGPAIGLALVLGALPAAAARPENRCPALIQEGKSLIAKNLRAGCEKLQEAVDVCQQEEAGARIQEDLRWTLADRRLSHVHQALDPCQRYEKGRFAVTSWKDYIDWYAALSPEERKSLPKWQNRIQAAVSYLQTAVQERRDPPESCGHDYTDGIRQMFALMALIEPEYVSADAMTEWNSWLWRCPTWKENPTKTPKELKRRLCEEQQADTCADEWRAYQDFLDQWLALKSTWDSTGAPFRQGVDLTLVAIRDFRRKLELIESVSSCAP